MWYLLPYRYRRQQRGVRLARILHDSCGGQGCQDCNWSGTEWLAPGIMVGGPRRLSELEEHDLRQEQPKPESRR